MYGCHQLPAVCITAVFAWLYKQYGQLPEVQPFIYRIKPAIIAVILAAIYPLAKKSLKTPVLYAIGLAVFVLSVIGYNEILLLFGVGFLALGLIAIRQKDIPAAALLPFSFFDGGQPAPISVTNFKLFLIFLKIGAILYGSGYVLFAFLDAELVSTGILSRHQLIDAIAVGQFTPGPVFSAVTFIGYPVNGFTGAVASTIAIFLPSFAFVALLNPLVKEMRNSTLFGAFLDAVNVASVAIILAVCLEMGKDSITDWRTILIATISIVLTFTYPKINSAWIVLGGAIAGYLLAVL